MRTCKSISSDTFTTDDLGTVVTSTGKTYPNVSTAQMIESMGTSTDKIVGMICYIYKDLIPIKPIYGIVALLLCVISCVFGFFNVIIFICFTYFLLWIGFGTKIKLSAFGSKHEMSYGMYLIGWPIQQVLCVITHNNISQFMNFIIAACVSVVFGFLISLFEKQINKTFKENKRKENL